jgi:hypothetical protein
MKRRKMKVNYKHTDDADLKRFSQIRKKSACIFSNLRHLSAFCLNQDSQDYRMSRMRKIEIENTETGCATAIYTLSSWHCCRDAMLRVSFGDKGKETNLVRQCGSCLQSPFIRHDASFIRREASRLYNLGDSDLRQNDGYRYTKAMSRMGLNMYNPLQAERSWGYKITTTLSELRSSSICRSEEKGEGTNGRKVQATNISSWLACLLLAACCLIKHERYKQGAFLHGLPAYCLLPATCYLIKQ